MDDKIINFLDTDGFLPLISPYIVGEFIYQKQSDICQVESEELKAVQLAIFQRSPLDENFSLTG